MFVFPICHFSSAVGSLDISTASYDGKSYNPSEDGNDTDVFFKPDGTKMYMTGAGNAKVYQYSLSTAWDVSTASYDSVSVDMVALDYSPRGIFFKPDGTKMYYVGERYGKVYQYSLTTAWDLSTASYDSKSLTLTSEDSSCRNVYISSDGIKLFFVGGATDKVFQYSLSTAWDVSTASYDSKSLNVTSEESSPWGMTFNPNGKQVFVTGGSDTIYQYSLSTAWDVSTASYDSVSFSTASQTTSANSNSGFFLKEDGTKFYIVEFSTNIYQYSL